MKQSSRDVVPLSADLQRNWGWLLGLGVLLLVLGCIGLGMTVGLTFVSMLFLGFLFIIAGFAQIIDVFKSHHWKGIVAHALIAVLYMLGGAMVIYDPILASAVVTALLAWMFIIIGITRLIMAIVLRHTSGWGWLLFGGLTAMILGVLILMQWPYSALWIIGMFIAIELIINGWSYIFISLAMRRRA
ncbi:MAG: HdeD family acid-resistance protein [Legionellaceae bacterium]